MWFFVGFLISLNFVAGYEYNVSLTYTEPAVFGNNISFTAITSTINGSQPTESFVYIWRDDAHHNQSIESGARCNWTVIYFRHNNSQSSFNVEVEVRRKSPGDFPVGSATISFNVEKATTTTTITTSPFSVTTTSLPNTTLPSNVSSSSSPTSSITVTTQPSTTKGPKNNAISTAFSWWLLISLLFLVL